MIFLRFLVVFCAILMLAPTPAQAQLKALQSRLWGADRSNPDFVRPSLHEGKTFHALKDDWRPEEWTESRGGAKAVIDGFYRNGLIINYSPKEKEPVVEVGDNFMHLSNRDKARVAAYMDQAYGITKSNQGGMFYLYYPAAQKPFGIYTAEGGLTLQ